ncbi:39570_t:CDS:2, partial [Gigaspora margarita]
SHREKRRAPNEDRSLYDNKIDWYNHWKREIKNLPEDGPLIFKPIFYIMKAKQKNIMKKLKKNKQLKQEIIVKKARINELEIQIEQMKVEQGNIKELQTQLKVLQHQEITPN